MKRMPALGWESVTVPGAVSAWVALSERYGVLPFHALFERAIGYAEEGFHVGPKTAFYWRLAEQTYRDFPDFGAHFLPAPEAGQRFRRPELARSLRLVAERGPGPHHHLSRRPGRCGRVRGAHPSALRG